MCCHFDSITQYESDIMEYINFIHVGSQVAEQQLAHSRQQGDVGND
jgi:hypothetical protein